ncbi:4797_t:CDS:2, partial [Gigaspora rosea]
PKSSATVGITSIVEKHNHPMLQDVELYTSKYQRLSDNVIEDIKFYVTKENMDLYNAIKKFKSPLINRHGDAQNMMNKLLELKDKKHGWLINTSMYLTLYVVIDNNTRSRLVVQCLSEDETTESYEWFLECILEATYNESHLSIFRF